MSKLWILDLEFLKLKGKYKLYLQNPEELVTLVRKEHESYRVKKYIKMEIVDKITKSDLFNKSDKRYKYLQITRRFTIPSEVIISCKQNLFEYSRKLEIYTKDILRWTIKFSVDEKSCLLKPVEIIKHKVYHFTNNTYLRNRTESDLHYKLIILSEYSKGKYKHYLYSENKYETKSTILEGKEAKEEIEKDVTNFWTFEVKPVQNVELKI